MASSFHAVVQPGSQQPRIANLTVDPAATFPVRSLVYLDTADNLIKLCGADPAVVLGFARSSAADAISGAHGGTAGRIDVEIIEPSQCWMMGSATTPADSHLTDLVDVVNTSNVWLVDTAGSGAPKVQIIDYSPKSGQLGKECFFVKWSANGALQGDGITS